MRENKLRAVLLCTCATLMCGSIISCGDESTEVVDPCKRCGKDTTCIDRMCIENSRVCEDKTFCSEGATCENNECSDGKPSSGGNGGGGNGGNGGEAEQCGNTTCSAEQTCVKENCVDSSKVCGTGEEMTVCESDEKCVSGTCIKQGTPCGNTTCDEGYTCVITNCILNSRICEDGSVCKASEICEANDCINAEKKCGDKICSSSETCLEDNCVTTSRICSGEVCAETQECYENVCQEIDKCRTQRCDDGFTCDSETGDCVKKDLCKDVICTDPENETCINGRCIYNKCIISGEEKVCENQGEICDESGECVRDELCYDNSGNLIVTCSTGFKCEQGICVDTACKTVTCGDERACYLGTCYDNTCIDSKCDDNGENCTLSVKTCENNLVCSMGDCITKECKDRFDKDGPCPQDKVCDGGTCKFIPPAAFSLECNGGERDQDYTDEAGLSYPCEIKLNHQPASDVHFNCKISNEAEAVADCEAFFTPDNYQDPITITITGIHDYIDDGDQDYDVTITAESEDPDFNSMEEHKLTLFNKDIDTAGFTLDGDYSHIYTSESGTTKSFSIVLDSKPTSDVTINISSSNTKEGTVNKSSLVFSADNWDTPQQVTVTGVDDPSQDGSQSYKINFAVETDDSKYKSLKINSIECTNEDNDKADVNLSDTIILQSEGDKKTINVLLNTNPSADVTVNFKSNNEREATVKPSQLTFTSQNYSKAQTITIDSPLDDIADGDQPFEITVSTVSKDNFYNNLSKKINGTTKDVDSAGILVNVTGSTSISEGASSTVGIVLMSKPTAEVKLAISSDTSDRLGIDKTSITFNDSNWNKEQVVKFTATDNNFVDGNVKSVVTLKSTSSDKNYNNKTDTEIFNVIDNDKADLILSYPGGFTVTEGKTLPIGVKLSAQPSGNVVFNLTSSNPSRFTVPGSVTIKPAEWNNVQTINLSALANQIAGDSTTGTVTFTSTSSSPVEFRNITKKSSTISIVDGNTTNLGISCENLIRANVDQKSGTSKIYVSLSKKPASNVTVKLTKKTSNSNASLKSTTVTLTPSQYQNVAVELSSTFTSEKKAKTTETIEASTTTSFVSTKTVTCSVTVQAMPTSTTFYPSSGAGNTGSIQKYDMLPGTYKLEVLGASGGSSVSCYANQACHAGYGGRSIGTLTLTSTKTANITVGKQGFQSPKQNGGGGNGWPDGGKGSCYGSKCGFGGGGSSDIRFEDKTLYHRLIVAGGGGGAGYKISDKTTCSSLIGCNGSGGNGGGTSGASGLHNGSPDSSVAGGTQTTGCAFGQGCNGTMTSSVYGGVGGGGGGWYGGKAWQGIGLNQWGGGGGSGFVYTGTSPISGYKLGTAYKLTSASTSPYTNCGDGQVTIRLLD